MDDASSAKPSDPSPTTASYSPSSTAFSSLPVSSSTFSSTSSSAFHRSSSTTSSSYSSPPLSSSPTVASFSPFPNALYSSSSTAISTSPTNDNFSSSSTALFSSSPHTNKSFSSFSTAISSSSPSTNSSILSSSTALSSSSPSTNTSFSSSSTALPSRPTTASSSSFSSGSSDELRLVLLGRTGSGKSAAGNTILGRDEFKLRRDATGATTQSCVKGTAVIGQKRVTVVDTPDLFMPSCPPEKLATHLSSCIDLCAPGPHAFLLCVPVTLPGRSNLHDLGSLRNSLSPDAIQRHTLVLFTHSDILKDGNVEEYIAAQRPELLELVEKCGDRYHVLKQGQNGGNIEELLEKVEQVVKESRGGHFSYQEQGEIGRERMTPLRRGRGGDDDVDRALSSTLHSLREEEEIEQEDKNPKPVESTGSSVSSVFGSVFRFVGQKVAEGAKQVPKLVAGGAVLGGVLGLYVGGPIGGAVGATAGSAAAEYGRRKYSKPKTD